MVDVGDDVRGGPGGDGREVDSEELTLLVDKVGDWRVGDWTVPKGKKERHQRCEKKKKTDQERTGD